MGVPTILLPVSLWSLAGMLLFVPGAGASEPTAGAPAETFQSMDEDGDGRLTLEEFASRTGRPDVVRRDFRVFDFDRDGGLTLQEFSAIPGLGDASPRGPLPDPFEHLLDAALEAMKESAKRSGRNPGAAVDTGVFIARVMGSLSPNATSPPNPELARLADPNADGQVTSAEALRFLEIELGLRWPDGEPTHQPDGRVNLAGRAEGYFSFCDVDGDGALTISEFGQIPADAIPGRTFESIDHDDSGSLSFEEFAAASKAVFEDPLEWFLAADSSLDGLIDRTEARMAVSASRQNLIPLAFVTSDDDHDGKLSLEEYRSSMLGNSIAPWELAPLDANDNYSLEFEEFSFPGPPCDLLRLLYFHRLDINGDSNLSLKEYPFRTQPARSFHMLAADGSEFRWLYQNPDYPHCGSPAVSPDGKTIAFDGRPGGQTLQQQRILMMSIDGSGFRDVCAGLMPTWSRDGERFACSRYEPRSGIWIINKDGSNARRIADGWAAQWSPDGETIAFTNRNGIWAYDVATEEIREVLPSREHPFRVIYWNMCWSPDSRRLVFKARTHNGADIASINMSGEDVDLRVHYSGDETIEPDTSWSRDGRRILFSMEDPESGRRLFYEINPETNDPPRIVPGIDRSLTYKTSCFTPDGHWIIVATMDLQGKPRNAAIDQ